MSSEEIRFGSFQLNMGRRELLRDGIPVRLGSRAMEILCALASAKGEVVTKDELMARVWPGVTVEENAIQVHVSALRKALDEENSGQSHIVTAPGRGYRLVGVQPPLPAVQAGADTRRGLVLPDKPSIAVLPFQNMSSDPEQEYFADGMVEDIIGGLSRIKWIFVIARNSSFVYKGKAADLRQVGRELGVRYLLEGSVRKAANRVRITCQLIGAETGTHLWAERYDRLLDDIFAVQDEITMSVIGAIEPSLRKIEIERIKRKRPDSLDAYGLVMRALPSVYSMMAEGAVVAIPLLEKALKLEPDYPIAHAALAWCYHFRFSRGGRREEDRAAAILHARAAITGGGDDATALAVSGHVIWLDAHDTSTALTAFDRALALSNCNVFAHCCSAAVLAWMGKGELAINRAQRALRLSPFDSMNYLSYNALAISYFRAKRHEEARDAALRAIESNPLFSVPQLLLTVALVRLGRDEEAESAAQRVRTLDPSFTIRRFSATVGHVPEVFAPFAEALRSAGLPEE